jgi:UDP-N-acetylmuramoylalanine--D-glutamate ligase
VLRPRGFADLADLTVGIWGVGREGTAALNRIRDVAAVVHLVDDTPDPSRGIVATDSGGLDLLSASDVVLKSPGISKRRPEMATLSASDICVTSALNLWMWETDRSHVIAVTGTKGKSTTTSLIAFFLRSMGEDAQSAGNIGQPPYEPTWRPPTWTVLEVSSFQAADIEVAPAFVVVTSLGADHLDWHGSVEQYWSEKLALTRAVGAHRTVLANDATLLAQRHQIGGDTEVVGVTEDDVALAAELSLIGRHNASNVAVAVHAAAAVHSGDVRAAAREYRGNFTPLPGRLTLIRDVDHVRFVDDGLATSVTPTLAALDVFRDDPLALIAGGFDRGGDYTGLAASLGQREAATTVITTGPAGGRIFAALRAHPTVRAETASDLRDAVSKARAALTGPSVVLLSPAAPSFDAYENWEARSADFARIVREI